jgi:hypothetical protein
MRRRGEGSVGDARPASRGEEMESMGVKRPVAPGVARSLLACGLTVLLGSSASPAALTTPDAMCYGRVSVNGQSVPGSVVSARLDSVVLDSYTVGSNAAAPTFYGLAIPVTQPTDGGEVLSPSTPTDGSVVRLFVNERFAAEVEVRSGVIARRDLSGGQTLCAGGAMDGQACTFDSDCPGGFCTLARALCDGGSGDGQACQCIGGSCSAAVSCTLNAARGTCAGGALAGECCDTAQNCADGATCAGSQRLCEGGANMGRACLRDSHCPGSRCASPTRVCLGGSQAGFSCLGAADCPGGECGIRVAPPTVTATPTTTGTGGPLTPSPTPTETPLPSGCSGDCDGSNDVTISELIRLVNIALGTAPASQCAAGDRNMDDSIDISELIAAVNRALGGCN